jgi:hypothetical protein
MHVLQLQGGLHARAALEHNSGALGMAVHSLADVGRSACVGTALRPRVASHGLSCALTSAVAAVTADHVCEPPQVPMVFMQSQFWKDSRIYDALEENSRDRPMHQWVSQVRQAQSQRRRLVLLCVTTRQACALACIHPAACVALQAQHDVAAPFTQSR